MTSISPRRRAALAGLASIGTLAALAVTPAVTSYAAGHSVPQTGTGRESAASGPHGYFDVSQGRTERARLAIARNEAKAATRPETRALRASLPANAVLDLDGATGTVRSLMRLDGYLTGASSDSAKRVALRYVRTHAEALGLQPSDVDTFVLKRAYRDVAGIRHLYFIQKLPGGIVAHRGLTAAVNRHGRLLMLGGSPVPKSGIPGAAATGTTAALTSPSAALARARQDLGVTGQGDPEDEATPVLFLTPHGLVHAWRTLVMAGPDPADAVFDATTGALLYRHPLSDDRDGESTGVAYRFFPGADRGGVQKPVNFTKKGWLSATAKTLSGNNSHTYSDVDDNNKPSGTEEVHPRQGQAWDYALKPFDLPWASDFCGNPWPCSWNPNKPFSWEKNRAQNATQVFFYVNNWHDHLERAPIGFTEAAGNFQVRNSTGKGKGGDPVDTQTDDGANTDNGLPDGNHIDNANMGTPPDGKSPHMQMYLQHQPHTPYPDGDPFSPTNVGDEADTVYHEYTHGLSNRLNVDVQGHSTLGDVQAGAMGEAWSDWYAMDYLVKKGYQKDDAGRVDVRLFKYDGDGVDLDRTEPIDCPIDVTGVPGGKLCSGGLTGHEGGYTYADYGKVVGGPEVHSDGEIWAQTLWQLRHRIGSKAAEAVVTRAMSLAPYDPSYLDMRNAILAADTAVYRGSHHNGIWAVFAKRGMGWYAGSLGGEDSKPGASFASHRTSGTGSLVGTVTDDKGQPMANVPVTLAFQSSGLANPSAVTDTDGHFSLGALPAGTYPKLIAQAAGYDPVSQSVTVPAGGTEDLHLTLRRDWAAESGGASIDSFDGPDFSAYGCGPDLAIDLDETQGWVSTTGPDETPTNVMDPKSITIDLHRTLSNVTGISVDPTSACAVGGSASLGQYLIETSPDNATWTQAASGTFTAADRGHLDEVSLSGGTAGVRYVRLTMQGNQTPDFATSCPGGAFGGCKYTSLSEIEVYGQE